MFHIHCCSSTRSPYFVVCFWGIPPGWYADTVSSYCPSRPPQLAQKNLTKHGQRALTRVYSVKQLSEAGPMANLFIVQMRHAFLLDFITKHLGLQIADDCINYLSHVRPSGNVSDVLASKHGLRGNCRRPWGRPRPQVRPRPQAGLVLVRLATAAPSDHDGLEGESLD